MRIEEAIHEIESYFRRKEVIDFLKAYDKLIESRPENHYFNSFGVNFTDDKVSSVKFYAHIFDDLTDEEILHFIPVKEDYLRYLPLKKKQQDDFNVANIGIALELKFKCDHPDPVTGFFYNLKNDGKTYDAVGFPAGLPAGLKASCRAVGINFEYGPQVNYKKYYYFDNPADLDYFARRTSHEILTQAYFVEYAESDEISKINAVFTENFSRIEPDLPGFSNEEKEVIRYFKDTYGLITMAYGFYQNQPIRAMYFFDNFNTDKPFFNIDTIRKIINGDL